MIDLERYERIIAPAREDVYDHFNSDAQATQDLLLWLYEKGWKIVPIEGDE